MGCQGWQWKSSPKQKVEQIGENLDCDMLPLKHMEKKNKQVTTIKETPCAYVADHQCYVADQQCEVKIFLFT